jgi:hypothetical protein
MSPERFVKGWSERTFDSIQQLQQLLVRAQLRF